MQDEADNERQAMRQQQTMDLESEWETATSMVDSQLDAKVAARKQREEDFQRKQQPRK